jgi:hypothetical protein
MVDNTSNAINWLNKKAEHKDDENESYHDEELIKDNFGLHSRWIIEI